MGTTLRRVLPKTEV